MRAVTVTVVAAVLLVAGGADAADGPGSRREIADRFVHKYASLLSVAAYPRTMFADEPTIKPQDDVTFVVKVPNDAAVDLTLAFDAKGWIKLTSGTLDPPSFALLGKGTRWLLKLWTKVEPDDDLVARICKELLGVAVDQVEGIHAATLALNVVWVVEKAQEAFVNASATVVAKASTGELPPSEPQPKPAKKQKKQPKRPAEAVDRKPPPPDDRKVVVDDDRKVVDDDRKVVIDDDRKVVIDDEPAKPSPSGEYCYAGAHPSGDTWEAAAGVHSHAYPPFDQHLFVYRNGCYHFVGDPGRFGYTGQLYGYFGEHPLGDGTWCFNNRPHTHPWQPSSGEYSVFGNWYYWAGAYDAVFLSTRSRYATYYADYYPAHYVVVRSEAAPARPAVRLAAPTWSAGRPSQPAPVWNGAGPAQQPQMQPAPAAAAGWRGGQQPMQAPPPAAAAGWRGAQQPVQSPAPAAAGWRGGQQPMQAPPAAAAGGWRGAQQPMQAPQPAAAGGWRGAQQPMQAPQPAAAGWRGGQPARSATPPPPTWSSPPAGRPLAPMTRPAPAMAPIRPAPPPRTMVRPPPAPRPMPVRAPAPVRNAPGRAVRQR
jgi:hypothetical protein